MSALPLPKEYFPSSFLMARIKSEDSKGKEEKTLSFKYEDNHAK